LYKDKKSFTNIMSYLQTLQIHQQSKNECVIKYLFNATLNCSFLCVRLVRLDCRLSKIFIQHNKQSFENMRLAIGLWSWFFFLVLKLCIAELVWRCEISGSNGGKYEVLSLLEYSTGARRPCNGCKRRLHLQIK
jgi:hypothetical protein